MGYFWFEYKWSARELRKCINAILKTWFADEVKKINYGQTFCLKEKKVEKSETKLLLIKTDDGNKLAEFISKNFVQIERMEIE